LDGGPIVASSAVAEQRRRYDQFAAFDGLDSGCMGEPKTLQTRDETVPLNAHAN
jgi:hypothetical protein